MNFNDKAVICGIYTITNQINKIVYVGQSIDIWRRWAEHINALDNNVHDNYLLQNDWNRYGRNKFEFNIYKECTKDELNFYERLLIKIMQSNHRSYNLTQ